MAELYPIELPALLRRAFAELETRDAIYDLERRKWWTGTAERDTSVIFQGRPAATSVGPAAGPQSQMVQNIVLSWLAGGRIFELKTVQILDKLDIPRPCIDATNIGYNVEWSQELTLEQSLREYVASWLALHILREADPIGRRDIVPADPFVFDMSVGYDLAGITDPRVTKWIEGMRDATGMIDELRGTLTGDLAQYKDVEVPGCISDSITLSTFHGCPPDEIERIGEHVLTSLNMDLIVKLNPTLLGYDRVTELVRGSMGYDRVHPIAAEFEHDLQWSQAIPLLGRLKALAEQRGRQFGIKLTNTLVVQNKGSFFSDDKMYMSGQPLHVLAMNLLWALRQEEVVGETMPISFSAGIDQKNYPDAVALGLTPVTTCTDLLRPGGYGRLTKYVKNLESRMAAVDAPDVPTFIRKAYGNDTETVAHAAFLNTRHYVDTLADDPRYHSKKNSSVPKKIGSHLVLFDCINCDKCIPVCPNNANFSYALDAEDVTYRDVIVAADGTVTDGDEKQFQVHKAHQLACYADFCNECGNCDIFCPEDGGPYVEKPKLFGSLSTYLTHADRDGYVLEVDDGGGHRFRGRMRGQEASLIVIGDSATFNDGTVEADLPMVGGTITGVRVIQSPDTSHTVEFERAFALRAIYRGMLADNAVHWGRAAWGV